LEKREGEITREIGTLNKKIAGKSYKERHQHDKDELKAAQECIGVV